MVGVYKGLSCSNRFCNSARELLWPKSNWKAAHKTQHKKTPKLRESQRARSDSHITTVWFSPCRVVHICGTLLTHFLGVTPDLLVAQQTARLEEVLGGSSSSSLLTPVCSISILIVADSSCYFISPLSSSLFSQSPSLGNLQWFEQLYFSFGKPHLMCS